MRSTMVPGKLTCSLSTRRVLANVFLPFPAPRFHHMAIVGNIVAGEHGKRCMAALTAAFQCFDENTGAGEVLQGFVDRE